MVRVLSLAVVALALCTSPARAQEMEMIGGATPDSVLEFGSSLIGKYSSTLQAASSSVADIVNTALSTAASATAGVGGAVRRGAATADALYAAYRNEYCAPAQYVPSAKMPANFTSPGFSLTFSLGNCSLATNPAPGVNCVGPYARYRQTPAVITSPYIAPGRFVGESCAAAAEFGQVRRNILWVFDKGAKPDVPQLAQQISGAVLESISGAPVAAPAAPAAEVPAAAAAAIAIPAPVPIGGSSTSSAAAVGAADGLDGAGIGGGAGGAGGDGGDAAAAGASGAGGRRRFF